MLTSAPCSAEHVVPGTSVGALRTVLFALTVVLLLGAMAAITDTSDAQTPPPAIFTSSDAVAPSTNSSCAGQSATSAAGIALRAMVSAQDDAWRVAATADGSPGFETLVLPATLPGHPAALAMPTSTLVVTVSRRDLSPTQRDNDAPPPPSTIAASGLPITPAYGSSGSASTLQDCAPRPTELYGTGAPPMWNAFSGSGSTLDSVYFEFSEPVDSFGAWFGDLETRTDGDGQPAVLKLFDAGGTLIYRGSIAPSTPDQSLCGGTAATDLPGCGNQATRWVGFHGLGASVSSMLVVVGDDDSCAVSASSCTGFSEALSWIGATAALPLLPTPTPTVVPPTPTAIAPPTPTTAPPTPTAIAPPTPTTAPPTPTAIAPPTPTTAPPTPTAIAPPTPTTAPPTPTTIAPPTPTTVVPPTPTTIAPPTPTTAPPTPTAIAPPTPTTAPPTPTAIAPPTPTTVVPPTPTTVAPIATSTGTFAPVVGISPASGSQTPTPTSLEGSPATVAANQTIALSTDTAAAKTPRPLAVTGARNVRELASLAFLSLGLGVLTLGVMRSSRRFY